MSRDSALDALAFAIAYRLMAPEARLELRISTYVELGDDAPKSPTLANLESELALLRRDRAPASRYDHYLLDKVACEDSRPPFDGEFWRLRESDLIAADFSPREATAVIQAARNALADRPAEGGYDDPVKEAA